MHKVWYIANYLISEQHKSMTDTELFSKRNIEETDRPFASLKQLQHQIMVQKEIFIPKNPSS